MKKRIAVVIRGQIRTWEYAKESIFAALEPFEEAHNVTYFFVTWDKSYATMHRGTKTVLHLFEKAENSEKIKADFDGKNLAKIHVVDYDNASKKLSSFKMNEEYEFISFIRFIANLVKQNYEIETGQDFDEVFEIRPDVFLLPQKFKESLDNALFGQINSFTLLAFGNILASQPKPFNDSSLFINDIIWISDSFTSDLICSEFSVLSGSGQRYTNANPHTIAADHLLNNKIIVLDNVKNYFESYAIIRQPEFFRHTKIDFSELTQETISKIEMINSSFQTAKESYFSS